jgi:hypothetical protein
MCTTNLTQSQRDKLSAFEVALHERINRQFDDERLYADLTGLFADITRELSKSDGAKPHSIFEYAALLHQELSLHCGASAYIMGLMYGNVPADEVLSKYLLEVVLEKNRIDHQIQKAHTALLDMLGSSKGLLTEFTDTFTTVHGITKNHLVEFISLGQSEGSGAA